ncbi:MAG: DUF1152 domain-containing protein [Desulfurococcales archaeon]|nr:DUF1152 domain-containing protein [Desulfurococcales archaeon]
MIKSLRDLAVNHGPVLVFGAGGGGDVVGALHVYNRLKELGSQVYLGALVWERYVVDPHPGPLPLVSFFDVEPISETAAIGRGESVAYRYGREIKPQVVRIAEALGIEVVLLDGSRGGEGLASGLKSAVDYLEAKSIVAVDVGGDILAKGNEEGLRSPLADSLSLYALHKAGETGVAPLLAVHAPGADGELDPEQVYYYTSLIARDNGLVETFGLNRSDIEILEKIRGKVVTEASAIPVDAFKGYYGEKTIRNGTRKVKVTPCSTVTFILDGEVAYKHSETAPLMEGTRHIGEASRRLNYKCIYTEYDLEKDIAAKLEEGFSVDDIDVEELTRVGKARVRKMCGS